MKADGPTSDISRKVWNSGRVFASWIALRLAAIQSKKLYSFAERSAGPDAAGEGTPHLLLLAWSFPPEINGGVYRPVALAKYAARAGWKVTVASGPSTGQGTAAGIELLNSLPPQVRVCGLLPAPPAADGWALSHVCS
jgi:hypothetical protein